MSNQAVSRRAFAWNSLALAGCCALPGSAQSAAPLSEAPATHNWMLVGNQTGFLSHLPMFERLNKLGTDYLTPHRFQVIAQASFHSGGVDVTNLYFAERQSNPATKMFTLSPAPPFVLPQVVASQPLTSFTGTVFRGHLERGGQPIPKLGNISVTIDKLIHFHKFDPKAAPPDALEYLLFGRGKEIYLAHSIVKPPSFDQILSVEVTGIDLNDGQLGTASLIRMPGRQNTPLDRIKENQQINAEMQGGVKLQIRALREFYFEEGELLMPATFDPTQEEARAGFSD